MINGFVTKWPGDLGERPALWIPGSLVSSARLQAATGKEIVTDARPLVTSPVLLAVRPQLKDALDQQGWGALPGLQTNPTALDSLNLPGWGSLRLALPTAGDSDATYLLAEAVAAASAPPDAPATAGLGAVNALVAGQPKLADNTAGEAWKALLSSGDPGAPVHAVATTEQQLFQRASSMSDPKTASPAGCRRVPSHSPTTPPCCWPGTGWPRSRSARPASSPATCASPSSSRNWPRPASAPRAPTRRATTW